MKYQRRLSAFSAALLLVQVPVLHAHLIYSFEGARGNETTFPPDSPLAAVLATPMRRGPGVLPDLSTNAFNARGWTSASQPDPDDYFAFALQPKPQFQFSATVLKIDERGSSTSIRNWTVRTSLDNFTRDLAVFAVPDNQFRFKQTIPLGPEFQNHSTPIEFRIYGYNALSEGGAWRLVAVELDGYVTPAQPLLQMDPDGFLRWQGLPNHPYVIQATTLLPRWVIIATNMTPSPDKIFQPGFSTTHRLFRVFCPEQRQHIDP